MTREYISRGTQVLEAINRYGKCITLFSMDGHFHNISVGLYVKNGTFTVWSFSSKPGVETRLMQIRNQMIHLGGMTAVDDSKIQSRFSCDDLHIRPVKFLLNQAVSKDPDFSPPEGIMTIKDTKSPLTLKVTGNLEGGKWKYKLTGEGEAQAASIRLRMVVAGFIRYGDMMKISDSEIIFPCEERHDKLVRLIMPYSRNISSVESMMAAEAVRGQMTTNTLGFTPL